MEHTIGGMRITFRWQGQKMTWQFSTEKVMLDGAEVPSWIRQRRHGVGGPDIIVKVEVRDGAPEVVELGFESQPGQSEVREKHLRAVNVDRLAAEVYAASVAEFGQDTSLDEQTRAMRVAAKFIERQRLPRDYRNITPDVLKKVAEVYRANISGAPTKAVAKEFGLKDRMASTYVDRARKAGHLPPTRQGQKKA